MPHAPHIQPLAAPAHWRTVDFISDLHLSADEPATFDLWADYLARTQADAVLMLGDVFEVWVGDDAAAVPGSFEARCLQALGHCRAELGFMHGNRDFLVGPGFLARHGLRFLPDPCLLHWPDQRLLLSHGDLLCIDDLPYQRFRQQVRQPAWQRDFLTRPLAERQALARHMREQSQAQQASTELWADVDPALARQWLLQAQAPTLIHGHTHRPADHTLPSGPQGQALQRRVLSDWHVDAHTRRAQVLRRQPDGRLQRLDPRDA